MTLAACRHGNLWRPALSESLAPFSGEIGLQGDPNPKRSQTMKTFAAMMLTGAFLISQPAFAGVVVGNDGTTAKVDEKAPKAKKEKGDKADKADKKDDKAEKKDDKAEKKAEKGGW
jgi:hypothetical protein